MNRRSFIATALVLIFGVISFYFIGNYKELKNPFESGLSLEYPSFSTVDSKGNLYTIDQSRRRISRITSSGLVDLIIDGGERDQGHFFYANEVTIDSDGNIYVMNWLLDKAGFFMNREEILRYDSKGNFQEVIFSMVYDEAQRSSTIVQRGHLQSLRCDAGMLSWFGVNNKGIVGFTYNLNSRKTERKELLALADADLIVSSVARLGNGFVYSSKDGRITSYDGKHSRIVLSTTLDMADISVPWCVDTDSAGNIYYTDLGRARIDKIDLNGKSSVYLSSQTVDEEGNETGNIPYYRISINEFDHLATCNDYSSVKVGPSGKGIFFSSGKYSLSVRLWRIFQWVLLLIGFAALVSIGRIIYVDLMSRKISSIMLKAAGILMVIGVSAILISSMIVNNFSARYQKEALNKIAQMVQIVPKVLDVSKFDKVKKYSDFMGSDYRTVREEMLSALNYNRDEWNNSYYFVLYRVVNDKLYGFMYLNGEIGISYPFSYFDDTEGAYRKAYSGQIATESSSDSWGSWLSGVGPVYNSSGEIVGLVEIGTDLYSFKQENHRLIREIILDVVTMLVVFVLLMIEITYMVELLKNRERHLALKGQSGEFRRRADMYSDSMLARPLTFIIFTAVSMSVVFIPIMMKTFYHPVRGLSENFLLALPISGEMLLFGVATLIAGWFIHLREWKSAAFVGFVVTAAGLLFSALSWNMQSFVAARAVCGFGEGFLLLSVRGMINMERDDEVRNDAFSHYYSAMTVGISIGAVIGGIAAEKLGFHAVFYLALGVLVIAVMLVLQYSKKMILVSSASSEKKSEMPWWKFLLSRHFILFSLMIILPTYAASTFLTYYFPLFAESNGISTGNIGRLFILNGLFIIYLGPLLSRFFNRTIGSRRSMLAGSAGWALSLAVFAFTGSIAGAVVALVLMGITEGFCANAQNSFFMSGKPVSQFGEDRSVGFFELSGKFAETLGPMIFAAALLLGTVTGMTVVAFGILLLAGLFLVLVKEHV